MSVFVKYVYRIMLINISMAFLSGDAVNLIWFFFCKEKVASMAAESAGQGLLAGLKNLKIRIS
ncbi:hypothetical protein SAMN02745220_04748 [Desulfopila aestuarii DSM 18488]|uniref:Uncharacterized protein n=1 Tax=Desulfopila aestuarii DSM 18488 TaxID=1121416 RepID=A0A1M7YJM5_9BACT|nr:hypothetical protein SAMN02745220_04748 [Desulfopila aestuarii DSM 18488]